MALGNRWRQADRLVLTATAGLLLAGAVTAAAQPPDGSGKTAPAARTTVMPVDEVAHVRGIRVGRFDAAALVEEASLACPTVRHLLDDLQHTDVMVLVEIRDQVLNRTGHLRFIGAGNGMRWLQITLEGGNRRAEQAAWLAHELRHALEVAATPNVADAEALRQLYVRIGTNMGNGQFETDAAVAAGRQALNEAYTWKRYRP